MKKLFIVTTGIVFLAGCYMAYLMVEKKRAHINIKQGREIYALKAEKGIDLLTKERMTDLRVDEYFLLKKVEEKKAIRDIKSTDLKNEYSEDPFKRLAYKDDIVSRIEIERKDTLNAIGKEFNGNFYVVESTGGSFGVWNDILVKALYCDVTGYDDQDFFILKLMHKKDGGYLDTHFLLALLLLKENKCLEEKKIEEQIIMVSGDIIRAAGNDSVFSDLFAERIVFLNWAGYGNSIEKEWIDLVMNSFNGNNGWEDNRKGGFSVHVTGLAILSLIYYAEGETKQSFY